MRKLSLFLLTILFLGSCNVLDVEPTNSIPESEAYKSKSDVQRGILGAYDAMQSLSYYGLTYLTFADLLSDDLINPPNATAASYREVDNNAVLPENSSIEGIWNAIYSALNVTNKVIAVVPTLSFLSQEEKDKALGELYFLRALHHFNLVNYFGGVPLKITPTIGLTNINAPRNTVSEVYDQIFSDLLEASKLIPEGTSSVRANKNTVNALLARVYLYHKDYAKAEEYASKVIDTKRYSLLKDYKSIFKDNSAESIFEIDFTPLDRNRVAQYFYPLTLNGRGEVAPASTFYQSYDPEDIRLTDIFGLSGTTPYVKKYSDLATGGDNIIILRLGEMYLIRAEARANQGKITESLVDLNQIRTRAGLKDIVALDKNDVLLAVERERGFELAYEGHRWFDLTRTNRAKDVVPTVNNINQYLMPIPQSELNANSNTGMIQNPGY